MKFVDRLREGVWQCLPTSRLWTNAFDAGVCLSFGLFYSMVGVSPSPREILVRSGFPVLVLGGLVLGGLVLGGLVLGGLVLSGLDLG